jgi:hypothetical protein
MVVGGMSPRTVTDSDGSGNWKVARRVPMHLGCFSKPRSGVFPYVRNRIITQYEIKALATFVEVRFESSPPIG